MSKIIINIPLKQFEYLSHSWCKCIYVLKNTGKFSRLLFICFCVIVSFLDIEAGEQPKIVNGRLDITQWDFEQNGLINLNGDWEFYWDEFVTPKITRKNKKTTNRYFTIPGIWNRYQLSNEYLPEDGFATFRLLIKIKETDRKYAIQLRPMASAYLLYIDGKPLASNGRVGTSKAESDPYWENRFITFRPDSETIELILWISNYHLEKGGPWTPIDLGPADQLQVQQRRTLAIDLFLIGAIAIMAFYHIGLFLKRRQERSTLYLFLFCFNIGLRQAVTGERFLLSLFPGIDWEIMIRLEFLTLFWGVPLFLLFIHSLYSQAFSIRVLKLSVFLSICFTILLLLPAKLFVHTLIPFHFFTILARCYIVMDLIRSISSK